MNRAVTTASPSRGSADGNPMRKVAVRNLAAHKVRLVLTLVSVILGSAFVAGSFIFTDTLKSSFNSIFSTAYKGVDAQVSARHSYQPGVPADLVRTIQAVPGVQTVEPQVRGQIVLVDSKGKKVDSGGAPSDGSAWTPANQTIGEVPTFASGRAPLVAGEVAVNSGAATKAHLHVGDHVKIVLPNAAVADKTVSGIYKVKTDTGGFVGVKFTPAEARRLLTDGTHVSAIDVAATPGISEATITARIAHVLPSDLHAETGTKVRSDATQGITNALSFVNYILFAFGAIALIVGTFIIYNTFSMIVAQRLRELALLRAVGADRRQVRRSVVLEAGVVGLIGSVLGLAGGVGLAFGLHALLDALDIGLPAGSMVVSTRTVVVAVGVGTLVTLLSAYAPARRAGRIPPVAAMREEHAAPTTKALRRRSIAGVAVAAAGVAATVGGFSSSSAGSAAALTGLGLFAMAAGALLLSPLFARWVIDPLGRIVGRPFGSVGQLARTNAVRNTRRTAATAFALTLGMLLVSGIAVLGSTAKKSIGHLFDNNVTADYVVTTESDLEVPWRAAQAVAHVDGVASATQLQSFVAKVGSDAVDGSAASGPLSAVLKTDFVHGGGTPTGNNILIAKYWADDKHLSVGDPVTLSVPGLGSRTLRVSGIYKESRLLGPWVVSTDVYRALTPRNEWADDVVLVKAAPGTDLTALGKRLEAATNDYYVVNVDTREQFKGTIASQINGLLGLLYGLLGLSIVIAILGILNTLALSVVERRREIGTLRAIGMQRKQVRRTIYLESALIAVFGAGLGLLLGLTYGSLFTHALRDQGLDQLSVPWTQAVLFLVLAAVVGVLAALWPGIRAARTPPLEAIANG